VLEDDGLEDVVDVLLVRVLAVDLLMAVTDAHWLSVPASAETSARALTLAPAALVLALASAFFEESALHVRSTKSPALMSFRLETALPWTGRVIEAIAPAACLTVMVLALASTETTSAETLASFFLESDFSSAFAGVLSSRIRPGSLGLLLGC